MPLFLDRLPLHRWVDQTRTPPEQHWSVRIPVFPTAVGDAPLPTARLQQWVLDTGFSGEAFAWRHHLEDAGLDPDAERGAPATLRWSATAARAQVPVRLADLWLMSNLPRHLPFYLPLQRGIAFLDRRIVTPDPEFHRALLGMRPLLRAGLKVELDFTGRTVSLWTP